MDPQFSFASQPLPPSSFLQAPASRWFAIAREVRTAVHAADLWLPEDLDKALAVAEVRQLRSFVSRSAVGSFRMAVIPGADRLSQESANALLKALEEPPPATYLLLLGETRRLLPTVASRVTTLVMPPEFATMKVSQAADSSPWQSALNSYELGDAAQRREAVRLLYLHPLAHQGIKPETIIDHPINPS